ncbi:hypothetical protein GCM10027059_02880 [Myceligenerans halotolerans]
MVLLRGPRGTGRRTAVTSWSRRRVREGTAVLWVDVPETDAMDGEMLGVAVRAGLLLMTGEAPADPATDQGQTLEGLAAALDAHETVLVVDRLGRESDGALRYLDRVARLLRRSRVVALTTMPLHRPDGSGPGGSGPGSSGAGHIELTMRDLSVTADEAQATAASLGVPISDTQARLLVTASAGWPAVVYPALAELRRSSSTGTPVTDGVVSAITAARRAAFLHDTLSDEAIGVLVEASLAPQFTWHSLEATGLLATVPDVFVDRLVDTGVVLDDPAAPDDVLAVEPNIRRALLDYAHGRDGDDLRSRAAQVARRRRQARDPRGALLVALESGDVGLMRDLLRDMWTEIVDGQDPALHEELWSAASTMPAPHVPAELRDLLSATRRTPGLRGAACPSAGRRPGLEQPNGPEKPLAAFTRIARLRRAGRPDDALRLARGLLGPADGGSVVEQVLVGLQAAVTAAEAGLLHDALRYAETAHDGAIRSGVLRLAAAAAELAALVHALDSSVRAAANWSAEADGLPEPPAWWRHAVGDPPALVAALAHLDRLDDDLPEHLLSAAREAAGSDLWFAGLHVEAMLAVLRRQEEPAVDHLRDALAQHGLTPSETEPEADHIRIPPLLALDLGRLYLALGRGTNAAVIAAAMATRAPAGALLDGRIRLAQGRPRQALLAVTGVGHQGSTDGARLEAHLLAAEALTALGRGPDLGDDHGDLHRAGALRELARAVALSDRVGGALPYWSTSPEVLRAVARDASEPVRERIAQVLSRRGVPVTPEFVVVPDRQLVVLHRLADGLTSAEVAEASFVSHNTVKTQIRGIYQRLGVHNRTAALQRARELGLLDPIVRARLRACVPS